MPVGRERAEEAIKYNLKALKKRHRLEEGAHGAAYAALMRPLTDPATIWKEEVDKLESELQQCYKAQSRLSEQLVMEVAECRTLKTLSQEREDQINLLQADLDKEREECSRIRILLGERNKALDLVTDENEAMKERLDRALQIADTLESENKMLIDRWMAEKMQFAEQLNEANAVYEDLKNRLRASSLEQLAKQQVDGVVRHHQLNRVVESTIPSTCRCKIPAHKGGTNALVFQHGSNKLVSGGQEQVKLWDTSNGTLTGSLTSCLGSVLDLTVSSDNKSVVSANSSNNLYMWDIASGRVLHTLTGHTDKVCAVDMNRASNRFVVSAAYDRTIKAWDLQKGYCINTIICHSNCNALSFNADGHTICSGHVDGNLRLWDVKSGKLMSEVAAHSHMVTSVSLSRSGNIVLTCGRDNLHNIFDVRTLEVCGTFKANGIRVATNWSRSCISSDDNYVAAGSSDGVVYIWSRLTSEIVSKLSEHTSPVLACSWSGLGKTLASADKSGTICIWE